MHNEVAELNDSLWPSAKTGCLFLKEKQHCWQAIQCVRSN